MNRSDSPKSAALLCFSHLRWNFVYQRPQHLLSRAARTYHVYFVEEPIFIDVPKPDLNTEVTSDGVWIVTPSIPRNYDPDSAIEAVGELICGLTARLRSNHDKIVLWYYTPMALSISANISSDLCVYDNMDELSLFRGASPRMIDLEQQLLARADIVFAGGRSLFEAKRNRHDNLHLFPSSVDVQHFGSARTLLHPDPADYATIGHPRFGFFGVIDERLDVELLEKLARLKPDWHFIMIGPVVKINPNTLPQLPNLFWLGTKRYEELPDYLAGWEVGIMPFALNEATRFISPTKTLEYFAAGVPVISTPIRDVVSPYGDLGLIEIASTAEEFIAKGTALLERERAPWLVRTDDYLSTMSWDQTWQDMSHLIDNAMGRKIAPSGALGDRAQAYV